MGSEIDNVTDYRELYQEVLAKRQEEFKMLLKSLNNYSDKKLMQLFDEQFYQKLLDKGYVITKVGVTTEAPEGITIHNYNDLESANKLWNIPKKYDPMNPEKFKGFFLKLKRKKFQELIDINPSLKLEMEGHGYMKISIVGLENGEQ